MAQRDVHSYSSCLLCFVSVFANGDSNPDPEIDQMLGYRGQAADEQELVPTEKKRRALSPALVRFQQVLEAFLVSDLEHHRQCECAGLIRCEFPVASNPARGGAGKDAWTGYCLHIGDMPG